MKKNYSKPKNVLVLAGVLFFAVSSFWACNSSTEKSSTVDSTAISQPATGTNSTDNSPIDTTANTKPEGANNK